VWQSLADFLVQGVVLGGLYALIAVGISLIFGVLDVINVAHGEFFAVGGYLVFMAVVLLHFGPALGIAAAAVGAFLLGLAVYPLLLAPLRRRVGRRPSGPLYLVLTLGLSTFMQNSLLALAGGEYLQVPPHVRGILDLPFTSVSYQRLFVLATAAALLAGLFAFLKLHRYGLAVRAVAQDPDAAQSVGIVLGRVFALTLALGVGLAGASGALMAPLFNVYPAVGDPRRHGQSGRSARGRPRPRDRGGAGGDGDPLPVAEPDRLRRDDRGAPRAAPGDPRPRGGPLRP